MLHRNIATPHRWAHVEKHGLRQFFFNIQRRFGLIICANLDALLFSVKQCLMYVSQRFDLVLYLSAFLALTVVNM